MSTGEDRIDVGRLRAAEWVGRVVHVVVDRPVGSLHPKHGAVYPINYGYVPDHFSPDDEELDVYVLGTTDPLSECHATVIAVVCRADDVEDKLVASLDGETYAVEDIAEAVAFQERYYNSSVHLGD